MRDSKNLKPEKKQHNHTFTDILKALIFSLVMLAPIFSIAVRCGYVMFNKNAYESYYGETINQKKLVNVNTLQNQLNYQFNSTLINTPSYISEANFGIKYLDNLNTNYSQASTVLQNYNNENLYCRLKQSGSNYMLSIYSDINYSIILTNIVMPTYSISFDLTLITYDSNTLDYINYFQKYEYNNYSYLDNAFTYGISNIKNETVFNWTQNTAIYTPINAMCTGLGITEEAISIMLTYWILMIAIYIIVDMIVWIFTKLTHILQ